MSARTVFLLVCFVFSGTSYAAINLTPSVTKVDEGGTTYSEVSYKTPEGKIVFSLPPGWTVRGQKNRAQITGPDKSLAEAVMEATPLEKPQPLDDAAIAKFKQEVVAGLPPGSTKVTTVSEAANSLILGGNPSFELVISFDLWGKTLQRSALLVNGPQDRLTFRFTCLKPDFAVLNTDFRRSLMSWHAVAAKEPPKTVAATPNAPTAAN